MDSDAATKAYVDNHVHPVIPPAPVEKTGQTTSYTPGDDGDLQKGVPWPYPRFSDNGDGTVTDNLTKLIWLKDVGCYYVQDWTTAISLADALEDPACGLSDGSTDSTWRLPNVKELHSLIDFAYEDPALSDAYGTGQWSQGNAFLRVPTGSGVVWSSTTSIGNTNQAYLVNFVNGGVQTANKSDSIFVWFVKDAQ